MTQNSTLRLAARIQEAQGAMVAALERFRPDDAASIARVRAASERVSDLRFLAAFGRASQIRAIL